VKKVFLLVLTLIFSVIYTYGQEVIVKEATGRVEYQVPGGRWSPVEKGMEIPVAATISTGFQSRAVLESPRSTIVVQPLTRLTIDELQSRNAGSQTSLSLRTGRISAVVKKNDTEPTRFQVKSPIATAAVRGTEFSFNGYQLTVEDGLVAFSSEGGRVVTVPLGGSTEMQEDGVPIEVLEAILQEISVNPSVIVDADTILPLLDEFGIFDFSIDDLIVTVQ
jgi:FecR protein